MAFVDEILQLGKEMQRIGSIDFAPAGIRTGVANGAMRVDLVSPLVHKHLRLRL